MLSSIQHRFVFLIALAGLVIAACGGTDSSESNDTASQSPLAALLGFGDFDQVEMRRLELEREEAVAECMRAEGFDYIPVDFEAQFDSSGVDEDLDAFNNPEKYGEKYGYGVVRNYELYEAPYLDEDGEGGGGFGGPAFEDPNSDYVESLSPDERDVYFETLYGSFEEPAFEEGFDDEAEFTEPPLEEQGCQGQAQAEAGGPMSALNDPEVGAALDDAFTSVEDNPRYSAAEQDWAECVAEVLEGIDLPDNFTVDSPGLMYQLFEQKKAEASGQRTTTYDAAQGEPFDEIDGEDDIYSSFEDDNGNGVAIFGQPKPIPDAALERLRALELEVWAKDWECQQQAEMPELRRQIEQDVVDDLLAQFPELGNTE